MKHASQLAGSHGVPDRETDFHHHFGALVREGAGTEKAVGLSVADELQKARRHAGEENLTTAPSWQREYWRTNWV